MNNKFVVLNERVSFIPESTHSSSALQTAAAELAFVVNL